MKHFLLIAANQYIKALIFHHPGTLFMWPLHQAAAASLGTVQQETGTAAHSQHIGQQQHNYGHRERRIPSGASGECAPGELSA